MFFITITIVIIMILINPIMFFITVAIINIKIIVYIVNDDDDDSRVFILSVVFCVFIFLTVPRAKSVFMYLYIPEFVFKFVLETVEFLPTERRLK